MGRGRRKPEGFNVVFYIAWSLLAFMYRLILSLAYLIFKIVEIFLVQFNRILRFLLTGKF